MARAAVTAALVLGASLLATGCARVLAHDAPAHGNLLAHAADGSRAGAARELATQVVVLVEHGSVRAIDPVHARTLWTLPVDVTGHPVANATTVFLPITGHRLVAVDRATGAPRFSAELPGEALTALAADGGAVIATVVGGRRGATAEIVALSSHDGHVRWRRAAERLLGAPAVAGTVAVVPMGDEVVALRIATGRELAREHLPSALGAGARVLHRGAAWFVGGGNRWVELGQGGRSHALEGAAAPVFPDGRVIDDGHGDDERLRLFLDLGERALGRDAILLSRRAVVAMRLSADGRPQRTRWVHREDKGEFVAMEVAGERVVLVREDGAIVQLSRGSGRELDRIAGAGAVRGALVLVSDRVAQGHADDAPPGDDVIAGLHALVQDPDPRLLPAQRLAAELLWRDDEAHVRAAVLALSSGQIRGEQTRAAEALRDHAAVLARGRWGAGSEADVAAVLTALRERPRFGDDATSRVRAIRDAASSGRREVIDALAVLLLDPGTSAAELVEVVETLAQLRDPAAVDPLVTFVRRYHADQAVAYESTALRQATAALLSMSGDDGAHAELAADALREVVADPLCEPALRAFIHAGLDDRRRPAHAATRETSCTQANCTDVPTPLLSAHL